MPVQSCSSVGAARTGMLYQLVWIARRMRRCRGVSTVTSSSMFLGKSLIARRLYRVSTSQHGVQPPLPTAAQMKELHEPLGWVRVPLTAPGGSGAAAALAANATGEAEGPVLRAHFVQICVVAMHQNGRDTHIRQVRPPSLLFCGRPAGIGSGTATFAEIRGSLTPVTGSCGRCDRRTTTTLAQGFNVATTLYRGNDAVVGGAAGPLPSDGWMFPPEQRFERLYSTAVAEMPSCLGIPLELSSLGAGKTAAT